MTEEMFPCNYHHSGAEYDKTNKEKGSGEVSVVEVGPMIAMMICLRENEWIG